MPDELAKENDEHSCVVVLPCYIGDLVTCDPGTSKASERQRLQGRVLIPRARSVSIQLSQEACDDLSLLAALPTSLENFDVSIHEKSLDKMEFAVLASRSIKSLALTNCRVSRQQLVEIARSTHLRQLDLTASALETLDWSWILEFHELQGLFLGGTGASNECTAQLASLRMLENLSLAQTAITENAITCLWKLPSLRAANLSCLSLSPTSFSGINKCESLKRLTLDNSSIRDREVKALSVATQVESLSMTGTKITDRGIVFLHEMIRLKALRLRSCAITDKSLGILTSLRSISLLDIHNTMITRSGYEFLRQQIPACVTIF